MKKYKSLLTILFIIVLSGGTAFASTEDSFPNSRCYVPDVADGAVSLETLVEWNKSYDANSDKDKAQLPQVMHEFAHEVLYGFAEDAVPMLMTVSWSGDENYVANYLPVFDENGEYVFQLRYSEPEGSTSAPGPYLIGNFSGSSMNLRQTDPDELQEFIESEYALREDFKEKYLYLKDNLNLDEYGGHACIHNVEEFSFYVWLVNEKRREELENLGYICMEADYSLEEYYEDVELLWENREHLGVFDVTYGYINDGLQISGTVTKEIFDKKVTELGFDAPYSYVQKIWTSSGGSALEYIDKNMYAEIDGYARKDLNNPAEFVEILEYINATEEGSTYVFEKDYFKNLKGSLETMKEAYPAYSCAALYYHVAGDCDAEKYLDFDADLLEFVDTLPDYVADKNLFTEAQFGDHSVWS